jgi:hypothetical protein
MRVAGPVTMGKIVCDNTVLTEGVTCP